MKRIVSLLMTLYLIISLCGCSDSKKEFKAETLSCDFVFSADDSEYSGKIYFDGIEPMKVQLEKPNELTGISLTVRAEGVSVACDDINFNASYIIKNSPFVRLYDAFMYLSENPLSVDREGMCERELYCNGEKYIFSVNCDSEKLSEINGDNFNIKFFDI